jgi:hypothetical protein
VVRLRGVLKGLRGVLGDVAEDGQEDVDGDVDGVGDGEDLIELSEGEEDEEADGYEAWDQGQDGEERETHPPPTTATHAPTPTPTPTTEPTPTSTLRNRHHPQPPQPQPPPAETQSKEHSLSAHRHEQEDLTTSLLTLASQLKTSSQSFQSGLEAEKSVLARAVDGIDRTATNMEAAEKRMGLLRRMTEGKGWWGRMMLYAWIVAGWVLAILIVFAGPKLRF